MDGSDAFARWRQCAPRTILVLGSLDPPKSTSQTISQLIQPFLHSSRHTMPIRYNGPLLSAQKLPISMEIWTLSNTWFLGPPDCTTQTASWSWFISAVSARLTLWQTDHATRSVAIGRIHAQCCDAVYWWGWQATLQTFVSCCRHKLTLSLLI